MSKTYPLDRYPLLRTRHMDEAREVVSRHITPHKLAFLDGPAALSVRINYVGLGKTALVFSRYGARITIDPGSPEEVYLISIILSGRVEAITANHHQVLHAGEAYVYSPGTAIRYNWLTLNCQTLTVRMDRVALEQYLSRDLDIPVNRPIAFQTYLRLTDGRGRSLGALIDMILAELDRPNSLISQGLTTDEIENLLFSTILNVQPHSYGEWMNRERKFPSPYFVKRVEDYILQHAHGNPGIEELVAISGVSASALFRGFRKYRGIGPIGFAKQVRLDRAREDLLSGDRRTSSVTDIALKWGFSHLSNFAADYARRFGETPSKTLRQMPPARG
jgi:AraC-like DNA-binding protein